MAQVPEKLDWEENQYEPNKFVLGSDGKWLVSIQINGELLVEQQRTLMAVIAAAPELLDALKALVATPLNTFAVRSAIAAIKIATGETT